jgi:FdhD protein
VAVPEVAPGPGSASYPVLRGQSGRLLPVTDAVAVEAPLTLLLNGREWVTLLCSPTHVKELVLGFLHAEGVIQSAAEVSMLSVDADDGTCWIRCPNLSPPDRDRLLTDRRTLSSCCGRGHPGIVFASDVDVPPVPGGATVSDPARIGAWMASLDRAARAFHDTGGIHTAGLTTVDRTDLLAVRTDVGRHNALDKLMGWCLEQSFSAPGRAVVVFSGRLSAEVVVKAARLRAGWVVSNAAPTSLGILLAERLNVTLVGFAREDRFGIYSHRERMASEDEHG